MPDILSIPTISISQVRPPSTIFDTADGDLTDITGVTTGKRGSTEISLPLWAKCGIAVESDCGCYPTPYREKYCNLDSLIETNFGDDLPGDLPLNLIFRDGNPEISVQPKTYTPREGCCIYGFKPLAQYLRLKKKECETGLQQKTLNYLEAFSHRLLIDQLTKSVNGNVSLPVVANTVNPLDDDGNPIKVSDCVGLSALQENHGNLRQLVAPLSAVNQLITSGLIARDAEGALRVVSSGTKVLVDPAWKGDVGPPAGGPWDGETPFNPAEELTTPDPGCVWMYMTGPIYVSQYVEPVSQPKENGSEDTLGNTDTALAELQTIAVFDPCDVTAVLIDVNKGIICG